MQDGQALEWGLVHKAQRNDTNNAEYSIVCTLAFNGIAYSTNISRNCSQVNRSFPYIHWSFTHKSFHYVDVFT